jgi:DNA topoisomerase VI subunit A
VLKTKTVVKERAAKLLEILKDGLERIEKDKTTTKNNEKYLKNMNCEIFKQYLTDISSLMEIPFIYLHMTVMVKGRLCGPLTYQDQDEIPINCLMANCIVPENPNNCFEFKLSKNVKFILVTEDEGTFKKAIEIFKPLKNCLIMTGMGMPDYATRRFLRTLIDHYPELPCLYVGDCNPRGLHIYTIYKFGAASSLYVGENLAVPKMVKVGLFTSELHSVEMELENFCSDDFKTIKMLEKLEFIQNFSEIVEEMIYFSTEKKKAQFQYLAEKTTDYLMSKVQNYL